MVRRLPAGRRAGHLAFAVALAVALLAALSLPARAAQLDLIVFVGMPKEETRAAYAPLAAHLAREIGHRVRLIVPDNVLAHWLALHDVGASQLILDDGHFTDYRVKRLGYRVLAKTSGITGFSVVTGPETVLIEPEELNGQRIACPPPPSLAALSLNALFPDSVRAPLLVEADSYRHGVRRMINGEAIAAVIRSSMVRDYPELNVVISTEAGPGMALSAAPGVPAEVRAALRRAAIDARGLDSGRRALARAGIAGFEPASEVLYDGYARLLRGTWGY